MKTTDKIKVAQVTTIETRSKALNLRRQKLTIRVQALSSTDWLTARTSAIPLYVYHRSSVPVGDPIWGFPTLFLSQKAPDSNWGDGGQAYRQPPTPVPPLLQYPSPCNDQLV